MRSLPLREWMGIGCKALLQAENMGALPRRWVVAKFRPRCRSRNVYLCFRESGVYPCDPNLCWRLTDAEVTPRQRLLEANKILAGVQPRLWSQTHLSDHHTQRNWGCVLP